MRLWMYFAFLSALFAPLYGAKKEVTAAPPQIPAGIFAAYQPGVNKAPGDVETNLDRPEFNLDRAFEGASPNARIDLYSGALQIQEQDLFLPGSYGVNLEINRDFNGKVYVPRADTQRVRAPDSWVGVGWRMNWGVLTLGDTVVVFDLAGYPAQRLYLATTGEGTDPAGNATHDYRFLSPITGDLVQPYLSKDFWRAWTEPSQIEGDPIWYVQDTDGKLFQIEKVDHVVGDYATTRIWHPMSPSTDITIQYEPTHLRIHQHPHAGTRNEVLIFLSNGRLSSINVGNRHLDYQVSRCGGNPQDPEERNCLVRFTNAEGEATEYDYGTQAGSWAAELDRITTAMGAVYTYRYADETYYHYRSESGLFNTRVVRRWQRGEQTWDYDYDHPQVDRYDEDLDFYVSDKTHILTTVEGPENVRRQYLFATYAGAVGDGLRLTTYAQDAGRLFSSAEFHKEVWNLNEITGAQYRMVDGLTEAGKSPAIYFTHVVNPEDNHIPFIALAAYKYSGFLPHDEIPNGSGGDRPNPFILQETRYKFKTRGETEPEKGPTLVWIEDPFGRPEEMISKHFNSKAPDSEHVTRTEFKYEMTSDQKTHNQTFLMSESHLFHNGPPESTDIEIPSKAVEATTPASKSKFNYNAFGEKTFTETHDLVTGLVHEVHIRRDYRRFQVIVREPGRDPYRVHYRSGLPVLIETGDEEEWTTLRASDYDAFGNMVSWSNSKGQTSTFEYDRANRIRFVRHPLTAPMETSYVIGSGATVRRQFGNPGPWEEITFDAYARKIDHRKSEIPTAQFIYAYDGLDRLVSLTHPQGGVETWQYDALGRIRLIKRERNDQEEIQRWRYWNGLSVMQIDAQGNHTFKRDDGGGFPSMFIDQTGALTDIETDAFGRVTKVVHGSAVRTQKYSGLGRLLEEFNPETGLKKFHYNSVGDMTRAEFFVGNQTNNPPYKTHRFEYDGRGRIRHQFPETASTEAPYTRWDYDTENLISIRNPLGRVEFFHDSANRLEERRFTLTGVSEALVTRYGYNTQGRMEWQEYPSGSRVTYSFDPNQHLTGATVANGFSQEVLVGDLAYTAGLGNSPNPVPHSWKLGNQVEEMRHLGPYGRPYAEDVSQAWLGGERLFRKERKFDTLGRVTSHHHYQGTAVTPTQTASYEYDTLSRLVRSDYLDGETGRSLFEDYYYDTDNNLLAFGGNGSNAPMHYPITADLNNDGDVNVDDLQGFTFGKVEVETTNYAHDLDGDGSVTILDAAAQAINVAPFATSTNPTTNRLVGWEYTPDGNVARTPDGSQFEYNTWNQLTRFGDDEHLAYGPQNNRILEWRLGDSTKKMTLYGGTGDPIAEYHLENGQLTLVKEIFYFGGKPVATDVYDGEISCSERIWLHSDYLGSPTDFTDQSGSFAGFQSFAAFGAKWSEDMSCIPISRSFTGHEDLADNSLTWMKARTYSNKYGRFLQPDPVTLTLERLNDPGQLNLYSYVGNSPTLAVDPNGEAVWFLAGAAIGGGVDLVNQLITNRGDFDKVSWGSVAISAAAGSLGGGVLGTAFKTAAKKYGTKIAATRVLGSATASEVKSLFLPFSNFRDFSRFNLPNLAGTQNFIDPKHVDSIKKSMLDGKFDFEHIDNQIGVLWDKGRNVWVGDGHHRVTAAIEIFDETGDLKPLKQLLKNAATSIVSKAPSYTNKLGRDFNVKGTKPQPRK